MTKPLTVEEILEEFGENVLEIQMVEETDAGFNREWSVEKSKASAKLQGLMVKERIRQMKTVHETFNSPEFNYKDVEFDRWIDATIADLKALSHIQEAG